MPPGTVATSVHRLHSWNPATRTLTAITGASASNPDHTSYFSHTGPLTSLVVTGPTGPGMQTAGRIGDFQLTPIAVPFLQTTYRDWYGTVTSTTDTRLDGTTAYVPAGTVGVCTNTAAAAEQFIPLTRARSATRPQ